MEENKIQKIKDRQKTLYLALSCAAILLSLAIAIVLAVKLNSRIERKIAPAAPAAKENGASAVPAEGEPRLIDGVLVSRDKINNLPLAVMLDNHLDAHPLAGLDKANLVFEAEAEGGMTRYLAIFTDYSDIPQIGPVRSARPYFVDLAQEYSALYVHVGGSPEALVKIKQEWVLDANEFYNGPYFWRDQSRFAPHNVLTSGELMSRYIEDKKIFAEPQYFPWQYRSEAAADKRPGTAGIKIDFRLKDYKVDWIYDRESNRYLRYFNREKHLTADGTALAAKNVILQIVDAEEIDSELRLRMDITGTGKALVCNEGVCAEGSWVKDNKRSRTRYYLGGAEAELIPGTTWVEILRPDIGFEVF